jgi:hypothetical protein
VQDAVITVPVFFNQAERLALITAAQLGQLAYYAFSYIQASFNFIS